MSGIGVPELIIIFCVVLLLFGSAKLPKLARSMGEASREFKKGIAESGREQPFRSKVDASSDNGASSEKVTLTRAELDELLGKREPQA